MPLSFSPSDRAKQTARRKAIYLELHPETDQGGNWQGGQFVQTDAPSFADDTAKATGKDARTVRRDAERGEKVIDEVVDLIRGPTPIAYRKPIVSLSIQEEEEAEEEAEEDSDTEAEGRDRSRPRGQIKRGFRAMNRIRSGTEAGLRRGEHFTSDSAKPHSWPRGQAQGQWGQNGIMWSVALDSCKCNLFPRSAQDPAQSGGFPGFPGLLRLEQPVYTRWGEAGAYLALQGVREHNRCDLRRAGNGMAT